MFDRRVKGGAMTLTNQEILDIAMRQSAEDIGCMPDDFLKSRSVIVRFKIGAKARKYLKEPITCNFVSYGNNIVAAVTEADQAFPFLYLHDLK